MNITIRDIKPSLWRELKMETVKEGMTIGQAINLALENWIGEHRKGLGGHKMKSFWDLKPVKYEGKDAIHLSMKVDETLYRWKS